MNTDLKTKILLAIGGVVFLAMLIFIIVQQFELKKSQEHIQDQIVEQKQIGDNIIRSQSQYATKSDMDKFAEDSKINVAAIEKDLSQFGAQIAAVNKTIVISNGGSGTNQSSDHSVIIQPNQPQENTADQFGYLTSTQYYKLNEQFGTVQVPIGQVGFSGFKKAPWEYTVLPRSYEYSTVLGTDEQERAYVYSKLNITADGKTYEVPIASGKTEQVKPSDKFHFGNVNLYFGIDGGSNFSNPAASTYPNIGLSFLSYGRYTTSDYFTFLELGANYSTESKKVGVFVSPILYNLHNAIPFLKNTYIGPSLTLDSSGNFGAAIGVKVRL